ncbi:MAG: protein kinase [Polyangiales bacterium]
MFREEASALLLLPEHPNIARFVTFDAGVRPKPILVMHLVEGSNLDRLIEVGELNMENALDLLLQVCAGLDAMHQVGVAHLDVKPSNIIVREPDGFTNRKRTSMHPVLVDFGLAGRHLRPGCGTAEYSAPEIWGSGDTRNPLPADVYAFACLVYETLTAETLFDSPTEIGLITQHVTHDGAPESVVAMRSMQGLEGLADLLQRCLRHDPQNRITIRQARQFLANLKPELDELQWPLRVSGSMAP